MVGLRVGGGMPGSVVEALRADLLAAQKAAVAGATEYAKATMRAEIRAHSTSPRLPNIIGSTVYPAGRALAYTPAGVIYPRGSKAELILRQLAEGAVITARRQKALAIPLHNQRGVGGSLLQPKDFPGLVYIPNHRRAGVSIGILALPAARSARNGGLRARDRRMQAAKSRARVQPGIGEDFTAMFLLVRVARIPRAFDPAAILAAAEAQMPALFDRAFAALRREG
jgi:hypothetical protein